MALQLTTAEAVAPEALHRAFTEAFSDYLIGAFDLPFSQWPTLLGRQAVDLAASRVALTESGDIAAFAFVAPRQDVPYRRLATMGSPPAMRGSGAAPMLLDDFIARATAAGMGAELECFEQNERALRLYRSRGFDAVSRLYGYAREGAAMPQAEADAPTLEEAFRWIDAVARQRGDLPLQVTPASLRALPVTLQARRLGTAQLVWATNPNGTATIHSLIDTAPAQSDAQTLVSALLANHEGQRITVPQLQRPDAGGEALERLSFTRLPQNQLLMRRP